MYFRSSVNLVREEQPFFIGWIESIVTSIETAIVEHVPVTQADVVSFRYTLYRYANLPGIGITKPGMVPISGHENIDVPIGTIKTPAMLDDETYRMVESSPFEVNFVFVPNNAPVCFPEAGTYLFRFELVSTNGKMSPFEIQCTIR